jgi:thymidylate synthase (FAD)
MLDKEQRNSMPIVVMPSFVVESEIDGQAILRRIERAGRTCYKSKGKITEDSAEAFVRKIVRSGHHSVLEHESVSVRIICDRGVSHELVRHRIASYSQESTRYCDYGKEGEIQVVMPPQLLHTPSQRDVWLATMVDIENTYNYLRKTGVSPQIARSVLPNALKTEIVVTMNLRSWRHFFELRCSPAAHPQMREIAVPLLKELARLIPVVFDDVVEALAS